jgi:hypothetical protein
MGGVMAAGMVKGPAKRDFRLVGARRPFGPDKPRSFVKKSSISAA